MTRYDADGTDRTEPAGDDATARRLVEGLSSHAVFALDADGVIRTWPAAARALYGYDAATAVGREVTLLFADDGDDALGTLLGGGDGPSEVSGRHRRADGSEFWGTVSASPLDGGGYAAVSRDTTARRQHLRRLEQQNDRLEEFADIISHDLRAPLRVVDGRLDLYHETGDDEHLAAISTATDRMVSLVDDLLQVARYGTEVTDPETVDIGDVIRTAWEGTGHGLPGAVLHNEVTGPVYADPDRLLQLFENLFRNGIDHAGGTVTLEVGPLEDGFYVADDGPGIPADDRERVFEHGVSTSSDGTGYGLSIVRTIANAHGWEVSLSEGAAGGARFEVVGVRRPDRETVGE